METNETSKEETLPGAVESARVRGREKLRSMGDAIKEKGRWLLNATTEVGLNTAAYALEGLSIGKAVHEFGLRMDNRVSGAIKDLETKAGEGIAAAGKKLEELKSDAWHMPGRIGAHIGRKMEESRNKAAVRAATALFESLTDTQRDLFLQALQEKLSLLDVPDAANGNTSAAVAA